MITNTELLKTLNQLLAPEQFQDYCPNGLQVEGCTNITKIVSGVSLNEALIDAAIEAKAEAIIVHHGIFWQKDSYTITGIKRRRIAKLIKHNINLYAYHLPLDNHPTLGNNIQLAKRLGIKSLGQTEQQNLLWFGELDNAMLLGPFIELIAKQLQHQPVYFAKDQAQIVKRVAWCTGGADNLFSSAINLGVDVYITGEVSEPIMSMALESGVSYIAAGHYATERYGIMALTNYLQDTLAIDCKFVELYNPV